MLNGGWDPHGFVTPCISRENENTRAFFGYHDYHIVNANATWMKAGPAYDMQTFKSTDRPPSDQGYEVTAVRQQWSSCKCEDTVARAEDRRICHRRWCDLEGQGHSSMHLVHGLFLKHHVSC